MDSLQSFFILMFVAALFVGIAQKIQFAYPIALVIGGTAIGFIPRLHPIYHHNEHRARKNLKKLQQKELKI